MVNGELNPLFVPSKYISAKLSIGIALSVIYPKHSICNAISMIEEKVEFLTFNLRVSESQCVDRFWFGRLRRLP